MPRSETTMDHMAHFAIRTATSSRARGRDAPHDGLCDDRRLPVDPGDGPPTSVEVLGQGTVIETADSAPQFCLGAIAESYPPQCSGPELIGWDWDLFDGLRDVGRCHVGRLRGVGRPTMKRASPSRMPSCSRSTTPMPDRRSVHRPGEGRHNERGRPASSLQERVIANAPSKFSRRTPQNGYLFVYVVHDDGSVQAWADASYRTRDVVQVRSALVEI